MPLAIDYSNKKYNKLTILVYSRSGGAGVGAYWKARCDCGNTAEVLAREVARGNVTTCGKCELKHKTRRQKTILTAELTGALRKLYGKYVVQATKQAQKWEVPEAYFRELITKKCIYCEAEPAHSVPRSALKVNQLERMNYNDHYHLDNIAPVCGTCRGWKSGKDSTDFVARILQIAASLSKRLNK